MSAPEDSMDRDEQLERLIGRVLKLGVTISAVCLATGLVLLRLLPGRPIASHIITVGLIVLLTTPALRVVVSVIEYFRERDWLFVLLTSIVLLTLVGSLLVGLFG